MGTPSISAVVLTSAVRTVNTIAPDFPTETKEVLHLVVVVSASSSGSVTPLIEGRDALGNYYTILQGSALTGPGTTVLKVGRALTAAANATANDQVPAWIRVTMGHNNANVITYSVCANMM